MSFSSEYFIFIFLKGKGPNIWDTFVRKPGAIFHNDTGDVATDSYHKYPEDVNLLRSLKVIS